MNGTKHQRTHSVKAGDIRREWLIADADGRTLGRFAASLARVLRGKHKPAYTPHLDTGDHVIVVNAAKVRVTGNKETDKIYRRHSGYPGGLREMSLRAVRARKPERIIETAVRGMLPKGPLGRRMLSKLKVYPGNEHPHHAQCPRALEVQ